METSLVGRIAQLPDGQRVIIEEVYEDGDALLRRIEGARSGTNAVCRIAKLKIEPESGSGADVQGVE